MRSLIECAIALGSSPPPDQLPPWHRSSDLSRAATGDLASLRTTASQAYDAFLAYSEDTEIAAIALTEAVTFARLAATHGHERDSEVLMFLLCKFADWHREMGRDDIGTRMEAAGLNLASEMADAGREDMAEMVARAGDVLSAATFAEAQRQRSAAQESRHAH